MMKGILSLLVFAGWCMVVHGNYVGEICSSHSDCSVENSYCGKFSGCSRGLCYCTPGSTKDPAAGIGIFCKKQAVVGETCTADADCYGGTTVAGQVGIYCNPNSGTCDCNKATYFTTRDGNTCKWTKSLALGALCASTYECRDFQEDPANSPATCSTTCQCKLIGGSCRKATVGEACSSNSDCKTPMTCSGSTCQCGSGGIYVGLATHKKDTITPTCVAGATTAVEIGEHCDTAPASSGSTVASGRFCNVAGLYCQGCGEAPLDTRCRSGATKTTLVPAMLLLPVVLAAIFETL